MIPSVLARHVRETLLDYLRTTFRLADPRFEADLFAHLDGERGLFRGPWVSLKLPFRRMASDATPPLEVMPAQRPFRHQQRAFERLYSRQGHQPQHTLVTTGTGSGKTECFLYPILDHCLREHPRTGVKAIILYPMNALAQDQARRLARILHDDPRLKEKVAAGLYIGNAGRRGAPDRDHLIDKHETLRSSPPDILLTNFKMLDFLLIRPEDRPLWDRNAPDTLRYLVLDELHTYDGAQGSDVACLIRRLKDRLSSPPGALCCVGTSATVGERGEGQKALLQFARDVFEEEFFEDSIIGEDRESVAEAFPEETTIDTLPGDSPELGPEAHSDAAAWSGAQARLWLGPDAAGDPVAAGEHLARHDFLRVVLRALDGGQATLPALCEAVAARDPDFAARDEPARRRLLESFLGVVANVRRAGGEPFLALRVTVWLRELRHLHGRVAASGERHDFAWSDEQALPQAPGLRWLPLAYCRECGGHGFATAQREADSRLRSDPREIGQAWFRRSSAARYVTRAPAGDEDAALLCPGCLSVGAEKACACTTPSFPVRVASEVSEDRRRFLARCPDCESDQALQFLSSRAPSLLSVAVGHLFQSDFNHDKKLLAFTDSVQDASHRSAFFGARTWRFNLRTALHSLVAASADPVALAAAGERLLEHWKARRPVEKLLAELTPPDLCEHPPYLRFVESAGRGRHARLEADLAQRLGFEITAELGLNVRVGRTLEAASLVTLGIDQEAVDRAAALLARDLAEGDLLDEPGQAGVSAEALGHFLRGLIERTRVRGGIDHPFLRGYAAAGGKRFLLERVKQPLAPVFGPHSVLPRFLTDVRPGSGREPVFDVVVSPATRQTWLRDWARRALGLSARDGGMNDFVRTALRRLAEAGVLVAQPSGQGTAWGLDAARLHLRGDVAELGCETCGRRVARPADEAPRWAGQVCPRFRCAGRLRLAPRPAESYYSRVYRADRFTRVFAAEHTGLLATPARAALEERFKEGTALDAPNLIVCTPTLELGVDIGDLSSVLLCSVPPATANYVQRTGRAGRRTGNALTLSIATSRPHDLYFHAEPGEMIAGPVLVPGCFLDAPEMLKRQYVAHAMGAWARQDEAVRSLPRNASMVLARAGDAAFPARFLDWHEAHREAALERFLARFARQLSAASRSELERFARGGEVRDNVTRAFEEIRRERDELSALARRARERLHAIDADPAAAAEPELEKIELLDTMNMAGRLIRELGAKYTLNVLTDAGVLPNYAFPEPGVTLRAVISTQDDAGKWRHEALEYLRPASSAIRELAPLNTFYAEGHRLDIDEVDIGSVARPLLERWRLCRNCHHHERLLGENAAPPVCPRCGDRGFADAGQVRSMVHFRRARSFMSRAAARAADEDDERAERRYDLCDLIAVGQKHLRGARIIDGLPFGWELLGDLALREVNFGIQDAGGYKGLRVAGDSFGEEGFTVCLDCGRVKDGLEIRHAAWCRAKRPGRAEETGHVFLYREVASEAIRILLPVADVELETRRASFKAALMLAFRRRFRGNPIHLALRYMHEPVWGGQGARRYLIVFDTVPGGTGYLSELWKGEAFLDMLGEARRALETCSCRADPAKDGCYRCLLAWQSQYELPLLSSRLAAEMLGQVLAKRATVREIHSLSEARIDERLESELEVRFLGALRRHATTAPGWSFAERVKDGEVVWRIEAPARAWEMRTQVDLGPPQGAAIACRPDFVLRAEDGNPGVPAVAVFCDGLAWHVLPHEARGRIADDLDKRAGLVSAGFVVWSITWDDLAAYEGADLPFEPLLGGIPAARLGKVARAAGVELPLDLHRGTSFAVLLAWLEQPRRDEWRKLVGAVAAAWLGSGNLVEERAAAALETLLLEEALAGDPGPIPAGAPEAASLARLVRGPRTALLVRGSRAALAAGELDGLRLVLRLFDDHMARAEDDFGREWNRFLHAANWLLLHPGSELRSSEQLTGGLRPAIAVAAAVPRVAESRVPLGLLELVSSESRPLVEAVVAAGLELPSLDFALDGDGRVGAEADLAWPGRKVVVLAARQLEDRALFERAGFVVLSHPVVAEELLARLGGAR